eukprot:TRINITY_DN115749_c0_g1_i1.p2 TRINITY_DN115749_c0_g1~~TRINITY_DN115749_c0_g1_i1.p2  ORF type:complete len:101 (+),score=16.63 TRINITY_DN115749_c0_g1_i1:48-350(+)
MHIADLAMQAVLALSRLQKEICMFGYVQLRLQVWMEFWQSLKKYLWKHGALGLLQQHGSAWQDMEQHKGRRGRFSQQSGDWAPCRGVFHSPTSSRTSWPG